jgi:hypothetical protein
LRSLTVICALFICGLCSSLLYWNWFHIQGSFLRLSRALFSLLFFFGNSFLVFITLFTLFIIFWGSLLCYSCSIWCIFISCFLFFPIICIRLILVYLDRWLRLRWAKLILFSLICLSFCCFLLTIYIFLRSGLLRFLICIYLVRTICWL